jgi:predicted RNase H-like HicB family nuclease
MTLIAPIVTLNRSGRWFATSPSAPGVVGEGKSEREASESLATLLMLREIQRREGELESPAFKLDAPGEQ